MLLLISISFISFSCSLANMQEYSLKFFQEKEINFAVGIFCKERDAISFTQRFAINGISTNAVTPRNNNYLRDWSFSIMSKVGVVMDGNCQFTEDIIKYASENRLFDVTRHWLIFLGARYSLDVLEQTAEEWKPELFNIREFLNDTNDKMASGQLLAKYNEEANADILEEVREQQPTSHMLPKTANDTLSLIATIDARVDSEVTLAIPQFEQKGFNLYEAYRTTLFTIMTFQLIGKIENDEVSLTKSHLHESSTTFRLDYNGAFLRAMCALLDVRYYSRTAQMTLQDHDRYALMGIEQFLLLEKILNFRGVVKCIDDYGWSHNGTHTGIVAFLAYRKTDIMSQGIMMSLARFPYIDHVIEHIKVEMGIFLMDPNLSQVTNIYALPFSKEVWMCLAVFLIVVSLALYGQLKATNNLAKTSYWDIAMYISGTSFNQGGTVKSKKLSVRLTIIFYMMGTLFLFISYSAVITTLLQSSSNYIKSVKDVAGSSFDVAIDSIPFLRNVIKDDNTEVMMELKKIKLEPQGENAYLSLKDGIKRVRGEFFAFQCDAIEAYKVVGSEFTEYEKCRLKIIVDYKGSVHGPAVPKHSPYKEILKQKYMHIWETGLNSRAIRRWTPPRPDCPNEGALYASVGTIDVSPIFKTLFYGLCLSLIVFFAEKLTVFYKFQKIPKNVIITKQNKTKLLTGRKLRQQNSKMAEIAL